MLPPEAELVWIDNNTQEEDALANMGWWLETLPKKLKLKFYKFRENMGFGIGNNKGAELATGDIFLFLSNDVIIHHKFYDLIVNLVTENPNTLFSGNYVNRPSGWNQFTDVDGRDLVIPYAEGWCLACTKELWEDVGGFDPIYSPADFEDVDLSLAVLEKGYSLGQIVSNCFVHIGGQTANKFLPDRLALTKRNQEKFINKWRGNIHKL
jgi:GT2 family glycosyltransferase